MWNKISISTYEYWPEPKGVANAATLFAEMLVRKDWLVDVVTPLKTSTYPSNETRYGVNIKRAGCKPINGMKLHKLCVLGKMSYYLIKSRSSIIFAEGFSFLSLFPALIASTLNKSKFLVHFHGQFIEQRVSKFFRPILIFISRLADGIFITNDEMKEDVEVFLKRFDLEKLYNVYNSCDSDVELPHVRFETSEIRNIFCIGRLISLKSFDTVLFALKGLTGFKLHFFGDGDQKQALEIQSQKLGINTVFHGLRPNTEILPLIHLGDIVILPSLVEGLSMTMIEAMSKGAVFIGSNVGGMREFINNSTDGFLFTPKDYKELRELVTKLLNNDIDSLEIGMNAKLKIKNNLSDNFIYFQFLKGIKNFFSSSK